MYQNGGCTAEHVAELEEEQSRGRLFERNRIQAMIHEREKVQKRTFTRWCNMHLTNVKLQIKDLFTDLRDGRILLELLQLLSGIKLPPPTRGRMRIHCLENVDKALAFLQSQMVFFSNTGAHDIVDGNPRITLGLIWTIILRFQITEIIIMNDDGEMTKLPVDDAHSIDEYEQYRQQHERIDKDVRGGYITSELSGDGTTTESATVIDGKEGSDDVPIGISKTSIDSDKSKLKDIKKEMRSDKSSRKGKPFVSNEKTGSGKYEEESRRRAADNLRLARQYLLLWCQIKSKDYEDVNIFNFSTSWRDGKAFNAILHRHKPELIDYSKVLKQQPKINLEQAFAAAETLGVPSLLDPDDVAVEYPDDRSIMTYCFTLYQSLRKLREEKIHAKRVGGLLEELIEVKRMQHKYEITSTALLEWIDKKIIELNERTFATTVKGVQEQLTEFNAFRVTEKAPKFAEKGQLDLLLFSIQASLRLFCTKLYVPPNGLLITDIARAWARLESAEHSRDLALKEELQKQEKLDQLAAKFNRKAAMREKWLGDTQKLVSKDQFGHSLDRVNAALQKQQALLTDVNSFEERIEALRQICGDLFGEEYHDVKKINNRMKNVDRMWSYLIELIRIRSTKLTLTEQVYRAVDHAFETLKMIEAKSKQLKEEPAEGTHLHAVEDLVKRHELSLSDMNVCEDLVKKDLAVLHSFIEGRSIDGRDAGQENCDISNVVEISGWRPITSEQLLNINNELENNLDHLKNEMKVKSEKLALGIDTWKHLWNMAVEIQWVCDTLRELSPEMTRKLLNEICLDQNRTQIALNRHQILEDQINSRTGRLDDLKEEGKKLMERNESFIPSLRCIMQVDTCDERLGRLWKKLIEVIQGRGGMLKDKMNLHQLKNDIEDTGYILDGMTKSLELLDSDLNRDEAARKSYLKKIEQREDELPKYEEHIRLMKDKIFEVVHELKCQKEKLENETAKKETPYLPRGMYTVEEEQLLTNDYLSNTMDYEAESNELLALGQKLDDKINLTNDMMKLKRVELFDTIEYHQFTTNSDGLEALLDERIRFVSSMFDESEKTDDLVDDISHEDNGEDDEKKPSEIQPSEGIDVLQHRFDSLENDMVGVASRVASCVQQGRCMQQQNHPMVEEIDNRRRRINEKWAELRRLIDEKKETLAALTRHRNYEIECKETVKWIEDKIHVVESTEELKQDLAGVMQLQRRMASVECDLGVIQKKINTLEEASLELAEKQPEKRDDAEKLMQLIEKRWALLQSIRRRRDDELGEAKALQDFLRDLDVFSNWLTPTQRTVMSSDVPNELSEIERALNSHSSVRDEITTHSDEAMRLLEHGSKVLENASEEDDPQYRFLSERLKSMNNSWVELQEKWNERQLLLTNAVQLELFNRDYEKANNLLLKEEQDLNEFNVEPISLEHVQELEKKYQDYISSISKTSKAAVDTALQFGEDLSNYQEMEPEIVEKLKLLENKSLINQQHAENAENQLTNWHSYYDYRQQIGEFTQWIDERAQMASEDPSYREAKSLQLKFLRHQAYEGELTANREQLCNLLETGEHLMELKKENQFNISEEKLNGMRNDMGNLQNIWDETNGKLRVNAERLFEANRATLFEQSADDINHWIEKMQKSTGTLTQTPDDNIRSLTQADNEIVKQKKMENELLTREDQVKKILEQADQLKEKEPERREEIEGYQKTVMEKLSELRSPIEERRKRLDEIRRIHQYLQDIDDETDWINEKKIQIESNIFDNLDHIDNHVQRLVTLQDEINSHEQVIDNIRKDNEDICQERPTQCEEFKDNLEKLIEEWDEMKNELKKKIETANLVKRIDEICTRLDGMSFFIKEVQGGLMTCEIGQDINAAKSLLSHTNDHKNMISDTFTPSYEENENEIKEVIDIMVTIPLNDVEEGGTESGYLTKKQNDHFQEEMTDRLDRYGDLMEEFARTIDNREEQLTYAIQLWELQGEFDDLEQWIAERELVASSHDVGHDLDQIIVLRERFDDFANETRSTGNEHINRARQLSSKLIDASHPESIKISEWTNNVSEVWQELLELMKTRSAMLQAAYEQRKFLAECEDALTMIDEKKVLLKDDEINDDDDTDSILTFADTSLEDDNQIELKRKEKKKKLKPFKNLNFNEKEEDISGIDEEENEDDEIADLIGNGTVKYSSAVRRHTQWMDVELKPIEKMVEEIQQFYNTLREAYGGDEGEAMDNKLSKLLKSFQQLNDLAKTREGSLTSKDDLRRFWISVSDLYVWVEDIEHKLKMQKKPLDVSAVELMINHHETIRSDLEHESMASCFNLGKDILQKTNIPYRSLKKVQMQCVQLMIINITFLTVWENRRDDLDLLLEAYMWARDASIAEAWLNVHEPNVSGDTFGDSIVTVEALIAKHEEAQKALIAQRPRFDDLKKLTKLEKRAQSQQIDVRSYNATKFGIQEFNEKEIISDFYAVKKDFVQKFPISVDILKTNGTDVTDKYGESSPHIMQRNGSGMMKERSSLIERDSSNLQSPTKVPIPTSTSGSLKHLEGTSSTDIIPTKEGMLTRKHTYESVERRASQRSWEKMFCVVEDNQIIFYKDNKHRRSGKKLGGALSLRGVICERAVDYLKRPNVFQISFVDGEQYLFQAKDEGSMLDWIEVISANALSKNAHEPSMISTRASTLPSAAPAEGSGENGSGGKRSPGSSIRRKLFSLRRKH
ncbi:hypothetical protein SNEBB_001982 [Seison nebaliae]|nr:hypothetical protein SNEBB_001982 [Seison nebaliae]